MLSLFRSRLPKFTLFITALCVVIYLISNTFDFENQQLMFLLSYPAESWQQLQYWRYFSHSLVHLSLAHLAFNLSFWWLFGGAIEKKFGSLRLILLYLSAAFISGWAQNWASGPWFFGLSGVVYAVMGFVFCYDKFSAQTNFELPEGFFNMIVVGILFGFISPFIGIEMGNAAHISGLLWGMGLGWLSARMRAN